MTFPVCTIHNKNKNPVLEGEFTPSPTQTSGGALANTSRILIITLSRIKVNKANHPVKAKLKCHSGGQS